VEVNWADATPSTRRVVFGRIQISSRAPNDASTFGWVGKIHVAPRPSTEQTGVAAAAPRQFLAAIGCRQKRAAGSDRAASSTIARLVLPASVPECLAEPASQSADGFQNAKIGWDKKSRSHDARRFFKDWRHYRWRRARGLRNAARGTDSHDRSVKPASRSARRMSLQSDLHR